MSGLLVGLASGIRSDVVIDALRAEAERLCAVMLDLDEADFDRPTSCPPWSVRELLAHVLVASNRLPEMLEEPEPPRPGVDAFGYYRPDQRFGTEASRARVAAAQTDAAVHGSGRDLAKALGDACRDMVALAHTVALDRVVRTRWDDAMLLTDFLVTRVVELAVHGLDLAAALEKSPWLTGPAAQVVEALLLQGAPPGAVRALGWDGPTFVQKATGRRPSTAAEMELAGAHGVRWLTLG